MPETDGFGLAGQIQQDAAITQTHDHVFLREPRQRCGACREMGLAGYLT